MIPDHDLQKFRELIYKVTGMLFDEKKNYYISSRIEQRLRETGVSNYSEYYQNLIFNQSKVELQLFVESITINETYFFRDFPQLQGFAEKVLPDHMKIKEKRRDKNIKIWSAACSTGEEAYTLAIIMKEMLMGHADWTFQIEATDIDNKVLEFAANGIYSERSMKETPLVYRQKYFDKSDRGFKVKQELKENIKFKRINFMEESEMAKMRNFDFVFCRNVLIYFDDESRKRVVDSLFKALDFDGHLFLGHSESIGRITNAFVMKSIENFMTYKKPIR